MSTNTQTSPEDAKLIAQLTKDPDLDHKKPKNCAYSLDQPQDPRSENTFCGLRNQGATCYLNSLIQMLYMCPEFRNTILELPLCKDSLEDPSDLVPAGSTKYKILFAFQKLFSEMKELDIKALTTATLTESFGWNNNQALVQQDIQEANRVIFDVLEKALSKTDFEHFIPKYFKGTLVNHLECLSCKNINEREESFYDLILQVKGFSSIEESLLNMLTLEKLEKDNQYHCEICNKKVDAYKGFKVRKFPPVLTLSLNRFEYDFQNDQMKKVNDSLQFGLELDISMFVENPELYQNEEDRIYELAGVLIHKGDPYSGHYHAYIRDQLNEGHWEKKFTELNAPAKEEKKPEESQVSEQSDPATSSETVEKKPGIEDVSTEEEDNGEKTAVIEQEALQQVQEQIKRKKGGRKRKPNRNKRKTAGGSYNYGVKNTGTSKKKEEEEFYDDTVMDNKEFPGAENKKELLTNWFDFNDSVVKPIPGNRIQMQFGGKADENAYILFYRLKALGQEHGFKAGELQNYLKRSIKDQNEVLQNEREAYKHAESQLEIFVLEPFLLNLQERKFFEKINPREVGKKIQIGFQDKASEIFNKLQPEDPQDCVLVEIQTHSNGLVQYKQSINLENSDRTISDLKVECWSSWTYFYKDDPTYLEYVEPYCGADSIPIKVHVRNVGQIISFLNMKLKDFRGKIQEVCGIPFEEQLLLLMEGDAPKVVNNHPEDDTEEIRKLGIVDNTDILVRKLDEEEVKKRQEAYQNVQENGEKTVKVNGVHGDLAGKTENLVNVLVERDDEEGTIKYYVDLDWTLLELLENLNKKLNIPAGSDRRLRRSANNTLFYEEELSASLRQLGFEAGMKLKLERGKICQLGSLSIKVKNQSRHKKEKDPAVLNIVGVPTETLEELKKRVCKELGLDYKNHKFYMTDWLEEPVQIYEKEEVNLRDALIKQGETLVLRDKDTPLSKEVVKVSLYITQTGFSDDSKYIGVMQSRLDQTLYELKIMVSIMPHFAGQDIQIENLRLREIKSDLFFGSVFRGNEKTLKEIGFESSISLVIQVLDKPENLSDDAFVFYLRKRLVDYQTYTAPEEFVWEDAPKEPTINDLKNAIINFKKLDIGPEGIECAIYLTHLFEWLPFTKELCVEERKKEAAAAAKKRKNRGGGKNKKPRYVEEVNLDDENLNKAPYVLSDGDFICYRLEAENMDKKDDFQTEEDLDNRRRFLEGKDREAAEKLSAKKNGVSLGGFQIYTDF